MKKRAVECIFILFVTLTIFLLLSAISYSGVPDIDEDGVPDNEDKCSNTPEKQLVDYNGCSCEQKKCPQEMPYCKDGICLVDARDSSKVSAKDYSADVSIPELYIMVSHETSGELYAELSWQPEDSKEYAVYRRNIPNGKISKIALTKSNSYSDKLPYVESSYEYFIAPPSADSKQFSKPAKLTISLQKQSSEIGDINGKIRMTSLDDKSNNDKDNNKDKNDKDVISSSATQELNSIHSIANKNIDTNKNVDNKQTRVQALSSDAPKFDGYIVEFKNMPLAKSSKWEILSWIIPVNKIRKWGISREHEKAKKDILERLESIDKNIDEKSDNAIGNEYTKVFNGISLDITPEEAEMLKKSPYIKNVYPNYITKVSLENSVPYIKANSAWSMRDTQGRAITGKGVTIGIIDTGVDYTHPDFGSCTKKKYAEKKCLKFIEGYDFVDEDNDPMDENGHGTHVASTAAGNSAIKGVAPDAKIVPYRVMDRSGMGKSDDIIASIERSVDPNNDGDFSDHLDIISLSLGHDCRNYANAYTEDGDACSPNDPESKAISAAADKGVLPVVAAGNSASEYSLIFGFISLGNTIGSPGLSSKALTVGAIDNDKVADFSSIGPVFISMDRNEELIKPDVVAPGVGICAALSSEHEKHLDDLKCKDDLHVELSGTSMATPHVSGVAALVKQLHPDWSPEDIKSAIMSSAVDLGLAPTIQGSGKVNSLNALKVSSIITPASLAFIFHDKGVNVKNAKILLKNTAKRKIAYKIGIAKGIEGASFTFSDNEFFLQPGDSKSIKVALEGSPQLLKGKEYWGSLYVKEDNGNEYRIPIYILVKSKAKLALQESYCSKDELRVDIVNEGIEDILGDKIKIQSQSENCKIDLEAIINGVVPPLSEQIIYSGQLLPLIAYKCEIGREHTYKIIGPENELIVSANCPKNYKKLDLIDVDKCINSMDDTGGEFSIKLINNGMATLSKDDIEIITQAPQSYNKCSLEPLKEDIKPQEIKTIEAKGCGDGAQYIRIYAPVGDNVKSLRYSVTRFCSSNRAQINADKCRWDSSDKLGFNIQIKNVGTEPIFFDRSFIRKVYSSCAQGPETLPDTEGFLIPGQKINIPIKGCAEGSSNIYEIISAGKIIEVMSTCPYAKPPFDLAIITTEDKKGMHYYLSWKTKDTERKAYTIRRYSGNEPEEIVALATVDLLFELDISQLERGKDYNFYVAPVDPDLEELKSNFVSIFIPKDLNEKIKLKKECNRCSNIYGCQWANFWSYEESCITPIYSAYSILERERECSCGLADKKALDLGGNNDECSFCDKKMPKKTNCGRCSTLEGKKNCWVEWFDKDGGCDSDFYNQRKEICPDARCTK
ncbi:S8 family serine peptidase [Candidatus Woesearchaeota archaeon]|nr:S8 family serine peptidase [Candidatus Woesearchaeota archaeon]